MHGIRDMEFFKRIALPLKVHYYNDIYYKINSMVIDFENDGNKITYSFYINGKGKRTVRWNKTLYKDQQKEFYKQFVKPWIRKETDRIYHPSCGTITVNQYETFYLSDNQIKLKKAP